MPGGSTKEGPMTGSRSKVCVLAMAAMLAIGAYHARVNSLPTAASHVNAVIVQDVAQAIGQDQMVPANSPPMMLSAKYVKQNAEAMGSATATVNLNSMFGDAAIRAMTNSWEPNKRSEVTQKQTDIAAGYVHARSCMANAIARLGFRHRVLRA